MPKVKHRKLWCPLSRIGWLQRITEKTNPLIRHNNLRSSTAQDIDKLIYTVESAQATRTSVSQDNFVQNALLI